MTVLPPLRSAALALMQQNAAVKAADLAENGPADAILAALNDAAPASDASEQARSALSESIFSVNHKGVTEMKLDLIERTGKALGVEKEDYASAQEFAAAMRKVVREIRLQPGGELALRAIERDLGLDELGLSIDDVIDAASDVDGKAGDKVERALAEKYGLDEEGGDEAAPLATLLVRTDEAGLYSVASA